MAYIRPFRGKWRAEVQKLGQRVSKVTDTEDEARMWAQHAEAELDSGAKRYKARELLVVNGADLVTMVPRVVLDASRMIPHRQTDVLAAAIPMTLASGIYFLIRGGEVVYVGQSVDVLHRIARHRREGKVFDSFSYMECDPHQMDRLESLYIKAFVPEENLSLGARQGLRRDGCRRGPRDEATADSEA
jgi:hypothetical protein